MWYYFVYLLLKDIKLDGQHICMGLFIVSQNSFYFNVIRFKCSLIYTL